MSSSPTVPAKPLEKSPPPRFRAFRRFLWLLGTAACLIVLLRAAWSVYAQHRLQSAILDIHNRGEPILPADFAEPNLADADNAAVYLRQAIAAMADAKQAESLYPSVTWLGPEDPVKRATLYQIFQDNGPALALAHQSSLHPLIAWHSSYALRQGAFPELKQLQILGRVLGAAIFVQHNRGDDSAALAALADLEHLATAAHTYAPGLKAQEIAIALDADAADNAMSLAAELTLPRSSDAIMPVQQIRALIARFLNEQPLHDGALLGWRGQRMDDSDSADWLIRLIGNEPFAHLIRPAFQLDSIRMMQRDTQVIDALAKADFRRAQIHALAASYPARSMVYTDIWTHPFTSFANSNLGRINDYFHALTDRRAAGICLAIPLWRLYHDEKLPDSLNQLSPDYLRQIPADPMDSTGAIFRYSRASVAGGPIIYSVGENDIDDHGIERYPGLFTWADLDTVYHLTTVKASGK